MKSKLNYLLGLYSYLAQNKPENSYCQLNYKKKFKAMAM
jgi:hypothetical protein